jgi:hypothetical protein
MALNVDYTWNFHPLEVYPVQGDNENVVFNIHWQLYASTGSYRASSIGVQSVGPVSGSFIPFDELTKDQIHGWVTASMNAINSSSIDNLYTSLESQIEAQINPPVLTLAGPWTNVTGSGLL